MQTVFLTVVSLVSYNENRTPLKYTFSHILPYAVSQSSMEETTSFPHRLFTLSFVEHFQSCSANLIWTST